MRSIIMIFVGGDGWEILLGRWERVGDETRYRIFLRR